MPNGNIKLSFTHTKTTCVHSHLIRFRKQQDQNTKGPLNTADDLNEESAEEEWKEDAAVESNGVLSEASGSPLLVFFCPVCTLDRKFSMRLTTSQHTQHETLQT